MSTLPPKSNLVSFHHARFTLLTSRFIRMEWAEDKAFEDLHTLTVSNRATEPVPHQVTTDENKLVLTTEHLTLTYTDTGKPFDQGNLEVRFPLKDKNVRWVPGKQDNGNLKGTAKTLDGVNGRMKQTWVPIEDADPEMPILQSNKDNTWVSQGVWGTKLELCDGLISKSGWAVLDDSTACVLDPELCDWQPWVRERHPGERRDLYFLGYGHDYKAALRDASRIFGQQPLPPRYALGYWYSRYWAYTDQELKQLVEDFDTMNLPLDVLVIDMDWHKLGWTGYSWDPDFFPDPEALLKWLKDRDLKITLNLHPADGVFDFEDAFPDMLKAMGLKREDLPDLEPIYHRLYKLMGLDPKQAKRIPLDINDPNYMQAYFRCLHHPQEQAGVDFWWMDWQQGRTGSKLPNLDTLPWINELHWQDQVRNRPDQRPINFSRFGGVGAGRMPVGFSGDTIVTWDSLAYQPYFTATAANVLYGYWSHDIGGHMQGHLTPELYTRWLQFGVFSPILRTHTSKSQDAERRLFHFPDPYRSIMMRDLRRRYELVPYIYREMYKGVASGLSLVRPMYLEYPEIPAAYKCPDQYHFGDEMIVAPVVTPMDPQTESTSVKFWLPPGDWFDTARGLLLEGGKWVRAPYALSEVPIFVRPGTVIPEQHFTRRLKTGSFAEPVFRIFPGDQGSGILYEDDGISTAYQGGQRAELTLSHERKGDLRLIRLEMTRGQTQPKVKGFKKKRRVQVILEGVAPPQEMIGAKWHYDGNQAALHLDLGVIDVTLPHEIRLREAEPDHNMMAMGLKGLMTRLERIRELNCLVSPARPVHAEERLAVRLAQTGNRIGMRPETFADEVSALHETLPRLPGVLRAYAKAFAEDKQDPDCPQAVTLQQAAAMARELKTLQM